MTIAEITLRIVKSPLSEQNHLVVIEGGRQYVGSEAWQRYHKLFGSERRYYGTIDDIRREYIAQLIEDGATKTEIARRLGVALRTVRNWFNADSQEHYNSRYDLVQAIRTLQDQQEEYEEEALDQEAA